MWGSTIFFSKVPDFRFRQSSGLVIPNQSYYCSMKAGTDKT